MTSTHRTKPKRTWKPLRRVSLQLMEWGVTSEMVALAGMVLGILAGVSFMATGFNDEPMMFWILGMVCCILRVGCIRLDVALQPLSHKQSLEDIFFNELPERVSDAVTLIGFGFAMDSSPWLGLGAALTAIFSAYVRSVGYSRGAGRKHASSGPMTRIHRLVLISLTSILMIFGVNTNNLENLNMTIPQIALWVIIMGCVATILIRWLNIREFSES